MGGAILLASVAGPAGGAADPPLEAVLATLPFEDWNEPNRVVVDLAPEGRKPFRMMLDTGAVASVMTPLMARSLGVSVRRQKATPYRKRTVLGRDLQFWVDTRTSDTGSKTGFEYGLLGGDFLDDYVVEIDFPGRQVRFLDRKKFQVPESTDAPDEAVVPLTVTASRPFVEIEVGGSPIRVLLDTGAPLTGVISGKAARSAGIDVEALPDFGRVGFVLGSTEARLHEAASFRFGGFERSPMPLIVLPKGAFNLGGSTDSAIGYEVLMPFVLRLDYERKRLWLQRTGDMQVTLYGEAYPADAD